MTLNLLPKAYNSQAHQDDAEQVPIDSFGRDSDSNMFALDQQHPQIEETCYNHNSHVLAAVTENGGESCDEDNVDEEWLRSPFASSRAKTTWVDEGVNFRRLCQSCYSGDGNFCLFLTACLCSRAARVGNMIVCWQRPKRRMLDRYTDELVERPQLICILGPYWYICTCLTFPFLLFFAIWTGVRMIPHQSLAVVIPWAICNTVALLSLLLVSSGDPGILHRYHEPPDDTWIWNDQAATWRPAHAKYDSDCGVVIEHFDHVCPWTGTAIGGSNMRYFRLFVCLTFVSLVYNVLLLTIL
ncbi:hypothetical protein MPSEU_000879000 [Mayamaea pseudoterrestris]|nr:hypothetical protein MPSEU_000879000 [Mayamaea pseudoterrestris]